MSKELPTDSFGQHYRTFSELDDLDCVMDIFRGVVGVCLAKHRHFHMSLNP